MDRCWVALLVSAIAALCFNLPAVAQTQPPSQKLLITAKSAQTWSRDNIDIVQLDGPVTIKLDNAELTAQSAVIWLSSQPGTILEEEKAEIALIGDAQIEQRAQGITRSGDRLFINAAVRGDIRITAADRVARDASDSALFQQAAKLRAGGASEIATSPETPGAQEPTTPDASGVAPGSRDSAAQGANPPADVGGGAPTEISSGANSAGNTSSGTNIGIQPSESPSGAANASNPEDVIPLRERGDRRQPVVHVSSASTQPAPLRIRFSALHVDSLVTFDDHMALQLVGGVSIYETRPDGDFIELRSERAILFTREKPGGPGPSQASGDLGSKITAAYLEGDVHIDYTAQSALKPEQRLNGLRVYYDFVKDQAIFTDVVLRTSEPQTHVPITIRAEKLRQLSAGEYRGEHVELSTSSFATPTYSVKTDRIYIDQEETPLPDMPDDERQTQTNFVADGNFLNAFGVPIFYWPQITGTVDDDPFPLRTAQVTNTNRFGFGVSSEFGLFELLGKPHPRGLDIGLVTDFYSKRGPAAGINARYYGANIDPDSKELSDFSGQVKSLIITDHGNDTFGGNRSDVSPPDQIRGKFLIEHQQFFPDHWEAQLRFGYLSDPTFLEEYYPNEFFNDQQYNAQAYFKRQVDTEAITFLADFDTNRFPTTADQQQEQFDIEQLPEIGYRRIGDSFDDDTFTFFSENTADRIRFAKSHFSPAQQGFVFVAPGIPSEGYTGTVTSPDYRADSRQEVDYPVQLGQIKAVPYVVGRLTGYTDSPERDAQGRVYGAVGVRLTTAFFKVDNSVESDVFDLHRLRHVIEPEINLYTSGTTLDRDRLFIYQENVDGINDISAAELALHQRWQTYRGGPGHEHSVDVISWNISADAFTNPPKDLGLLPEKFRGIYFPSMPEASIPRDAINSDITWEVSETTALLADMEYNVDHAVLATGSIGLAAKHGDRLSYYVGLRYIEQLNSDIATFAADYELSAKYTLEFSQSFDFGQSKNVDTTVTVQRRFDTVVGEFGIFHESVTGESGVRFSIYPLGLGNSNGLGSVNNLFSNAR